MKRARVWDPLYGRIDLSDFEFSLIRLPEVQRLRYIRMCNINSLLVTGASEISRFEHTLGVLRLTQEWISAHPMHSATANDLKAAAILHDMQTGPFGHSLQYVFEDNKVEGDFTHDDISHGSRSAYHQELEAKTCFLGVPFGAQTLLGKNWQSVSSLIRGEGALGKLISGTIDLDNIDNVVRLAYHVGVANSNDAQLALDLARIIIIDKNSLTVPVCAIEKIQRWQEIRKALYKLLLLDWAEFSAKAMLTRAMEKAIERNLIGSDCWLYTDTELLNYLETSAVGNAQETGELVKRLKGGDLYDPIALLGSPSVEKYDYLSSVKTKLELEASLIRFAKKKLKLTIKPLIHFILDKGKTERAVDVTVQENSEVITIGRSSKALLIGFFISKSGLSASDVSALTNHLTELLQHFGVNSITSLEDPMGEDRCAPQLNLL